MKSQVLTLVTGATGNLGNAITKQLVNEGRSVRCLVRSINQAKLLLPDAVELIEGDLTDEASIKFAMKGVESVFHAGGLPEQWQKDTSIFEKVNTQGTKYLIDAALEEGVKCFVYTSTQDVFDFSQAIFDETMPLPMPASNPNSSPYEKSKLLAQNLIDEAVKKKGLPAVSLHPVAIYGPCVSQPTGLTRLIDELRTNQIPVLLKGGLPVVFNEDAARAHILAEQKAEIGEKFLLIDESYSLKEIAEKVSKVCPTAKVPKMMPDLVADLIASIGEAISKLIGKAPLITKSELGVLRRRGRPNGSKIKEQLGWETTSFDDGVRKTIHSLEEL